MQAMRGQHRRGNDHRRHPAAQQPRAEQFPPRFQPPLQRVQGYSQPADGLVPRQPVEPAEHDRPAEPFGQAVEFLVEHSPHVLPGHICERVGRVNRFGRAGRRKPPEWFRGALGQRLAGRPQ